MWESEQKKNSRSKCNIEPHCGNVSLLKEIAIRAVIVKNSAVPVLIHKQLLEKYQQPFGSIHMQP